jgi:L-aminopeptidase/D-esterase-like protein
MVRPGKRNLITDVPGIKVGQAGDERARSGVTVVLPDAAARTVVDIRGGAPGTRETDALDPAASPEPEGRDRAVGGSAFGYAARA